MRARAPASSANLGPGFDTLAVALSLYAEVEVEKAPSLRIESTGMGANLPQDESHLSARIAREVLGHDRVSIHVHSEIPLAAGLGSSSAVSVATAAALGVDDPLEIAVAFDGHCDNAAASLVGGLITATTVGDRTQATSLFLDPDISFVVVVPDLQLSTEASRQLLPSTISRGDAVFNLGRMGWLIAALGDCESLAAEATEDRLHQAHRTPLFPESPDLLQCMIEAGASATCWSGAGPSLLAILPHERAETVRSAAESRLAELELSGSVLVVEADRCGLQIL